MILPPLLFVSDPERTPDPAAVAGRLPRGAGVVYRTFGRPEAEIVARAPRRDRQPPWPDPAHRRDERLAMRCGAHGVHLPERRIAAAPGLRARHPDWLITGAAHSARALAAARRSGLDAALLSPVFDSRSPSAAALARLGPVRFAALVRAADLPVYALGGVNAATARRLERSGAAGLAAVEGVLG